MGNENPLGASRSAETHEDLPLVAAFASLSLAEVLGVLEPEWPMPAIRELFANGNVVGRQRDAAGPTAELRPLSPRLALAQVARWQLRQIVPEERHIFRRSEAEDDSRVPTVLLETDDLLALSKPAGVAVVPDRSASRESCLGWLIAREIKARPTRSVEAYRRPRIVHRIDRFTSGLVLVAKTPAMERRLAADFEHRRVRKEYRALLVGTVEAAVVDVHVPVGPGRKGRMRCGGAGAREASTRFEVIERLGDFTWVAARPRTGRTHQIRLHALAMGHPLAVDPLYRTAEFSSDPRPPGTERLTLHALACELPADAPEPRRFSAPLAPDLAATLDRLRASPSR